MILGVGLIQLVLVLATIYVANERNRNWVFWGAAAFFMPVVALVIVGLLDPVRPLATRPILAVCASCGRIAPDSTARFCSACGNTLPQG